MLWLETRSGHAVYANEITLLYRRSPFTLNLLVRLPGAPLDRFPAGPSSHSERRSDPRELSRAAPKPVSR